MQGRLSRPNYGKIQSFPVSSWREEFEKASSCGFEVIEWIFDRHVPNPILSAEGTSEIRSLCTKYGIMVNSVCADYFMKNKLFHESKLELEKNRETLKKLILQAAKLEISIIEVPLVDSSSLKTANNKIEFKNNLDKVIPMAEKNDVFIVLETDLPPLKFKELLLQFNHPNVLANYDSGNSASLGYNPREELTTLKEWIKNIHVKDRKFKGGTVPLGSGDTDFDLFFSTLSEIQYSGDLIIQGARLPDSEFTPESTCRLYQKFVKEYLDKYYS